MKKRTCHDVLNDRIDGLMGKYPNIAEHVIQEEEGSVHMTEEPTCKDLRGTIRRIYEIARKEGHKDIEGPYEPEKKE